MHSSPPPKHGTRPARLKTALGEDELVLVRFDATEGLSQLFQYRIEALSAKDVDYNAIIGRPCRVTIESYDNAKRSFHGILTEAQWVGVRQEHQVHRLLVRPWLWLLTKTSDCRFFLDKTAPDIIQEVFRDRGFNDYRLDLSENHPKREYCVQYRETDFAFVSRLMEHEGIYHYFEHTDDKHTLVLVDSMSKHRPAPGLASVDFVPRGTPDKRRRQHIYDLVSERRFRSGKVELNDYYEITPNADLKADKNKPGQYEKSQMELYDYPGKYKKKNEGEHYAKVVLEAEQALDERRHTAGEAVSLFPGCTTKLQGHNKKDENKEYLVVHCSHAYTAQLYRSGTDPGQEYSGHYELLPKDGKVYRAPIVTPKPRIHGIQTAKVVGEKGEEIDVDEYGRIKVEFFWDRKKKQSCRIRVAEMWAGKKWGWQFIPRIGMEVVVEFLEGDPDRPLVVGSVYNGEYKHPYDLPGNKTQSGVKSRSTKDCPDGFNQIQFEDQTNAEQINMHAQKDHNVIVKHAETWKIGEKFEAPTGMPSREVTLQKGDDKLKISTGSRDTDIALMDQLKAGVLIKLECGASKITMTPATISIEAPMIMLKGGLIMIN